MDNYLSLFFIPVLRVKKGDEIWQCTSCGAAYRGAPPEMNSRRAQSGCPNCGREMEPGFKFCPGCGAKL